VTSFPGLKNYVIIPSENLAERENQIGDYSPHNCFKLAKTHRAYGWARCQRGDWNQEQQDAYDRGYRDEEDK
jgi:hypothetical protein